MPFLITLLVLSLLLLRKFVQADQYTRAGKYQAWGPELFLGGDITGKH